VRNNIARRRPIHETFVREMILRVEVEKRNANTLQSARWHITFALLGGAVCAVRQNQNKSATNENRVARQGQRGF
jgi:hypothetical protein